MTAVDFPPTPPASAASTSTTFTDVDDYKCVPDGQSEGDESRWDQRLDRGGFCWHQRQDLIHRGQIKRGLITSFEHDDSAPEVRLLPRGMTQSNQNSCEMTAAYELRKLDDDNLYLLIRSSRDASRFATCRLSTQVPLNDHVVQIEDALTMCTVYVKALGDDTSVVCCHLAEVVRGREAPLRAQLNLVGG